MKFPATIEPSVGSGYRITLQSPFELSACGSTEEEAIANLQREAIRLQGLNRRIIYVELPGIEHSFAKFAGDWKDDPLLEDFEKNIEDFRKERDQLDEQVFGTHDVRH